MNKAATQFVKNILRNYAIMHNMKHADFSSYAFQTGFPYLDTLPEDEMIKYQHLFRNHGYLYSVFGGMIEGIPDLKKYLAILMIRDPRDILVSRYFSIAYSHPEPKPISEKHDNFLRDRTYARSLGINEFVLEKSDLIYRIFDRYRKFLLGRHDNVYLTSYEEMVSDFENWLIKLLAYCEFAADKNYMDLTIDEFYRLKPKKENTYKRMRKGEIGDYEKKLSTETIDCLNKKFADVLVDFGYAS